MTMLRRIILTVAVALFAPTFHATAIAQVVVHSGDTIVTAGDSITARGWEYALGGLLDQINVTLKKGATIAASGAVPSVTGVVGQAIGYTAINTGINGQTTTDIVNNITAQVTGPSPNVVILLIGVNDVGNRLSTSTTLSNMTSILSTIHSSLPNTQIALVSIMCFGEGWTAGPPLAFSNGSTDTALNTDNANYQSLCASTSHCTYVDIRTPLLNIEPAINPTSQNQAFTADGVHPIQPGSEVTMGTWSRPSFTVVP